MCLRVCATAAMYSTGSVGARSSALEARSSALEARSSALEARSSALMTLLVATRYFCLT